MREEVSADGLTQRMRRWVEARRRGMGQLDATRYAGYSGSADTLMVRGSKLARHPKIIAALSQQVDPDEDDEAAAEVPKPQAGPQTAFADCTADIAFLGGAAGGGKTWSLLFEPVKHALFERGRWRLPSGLRVVLFRRTNPELMGGGGLWDESHEMYLPLGGRARRAPNPDWIFPGFTTNESGEVVGGRDARIELRHLQTEGAIYGHQGRQYSIVLFDEITHFTERQFWYLFGRLRGRGVRPYVRATCNPDPDSFVAKLVAWWIDEAGFAIPERSGVLRWIVRVGDALEWFDSREAALEQRPGSDPISFTFIPAKLSDNERVDPNYRAKLRALPRVDSERLLGGNWKIKASAGMYFQRENFRIVDGPPYRIVQSVRAWDKAASKPTQAYPDPDWTRGVRMHLLANGGLYIDNVRSIRDGPASVLLFMRRTAAGERDQSGDLIERGDGLSVLIGLWQDQAGAGKTDAGLTASALSGYPVQIVHVQESAVVGPKVKNRAKLAHAKIWTRKQKDGLVYVLGGQPWTGELIDECDNFPAGAHDDIVDAISLGAHILLGDDGSGFWAADTNAVLAAVDSIKGNKRKR